MKTIVANCGCWQETNEMGRVTDSVTCHRHSEDDGSLAGLAKGIGSVIVLVMLISFVYMLLG